MTTRPPRAGPTTGAWWSRPPADAPSLSPGPAPRGTGPFSWVPRPPEPDLAGVCHILSPASRPHFAGFVTVFRPMRRLRRGAAEYRPIDAMNTAMQAPQGANGYADCLEAIRARMAAREAKLYGIAIVVVYVHQLERLLASAGQVNAGRMLDELRNRLSQVSQAGRLFRAARRTQVRVRPVEPAQRGPRSARSQQGAARRQRAGSPRAASNESFRLSIGIAMFPAHGRAPGGAHAVRRDRAARGVEDAAADGGLRRGQGGGACSRLGSREASLRTRSSRATSYSLTSRSCRSRSWRSSAARR